MDIIEEFKAELTEGYIRFRDNLQFELKSEFILNPKIKQNVFKQEFYIFIPETLQVNKTTYSKKHFYSDQTNLIRLKTPQVSLQSLISPDNIKSPLIKLQLLIEQPNEMSKSKVIEDLKIFGNLFRSALRDQIIHLLHSLEKKDPIDFSHKVDSLCSDIQNVRAKYLEIQNFFVQHYANAFLKYFFRYTDEFLSHMIDYHFTGLLKIIRDRKLENSTEIDNKICNLLIHEQEHRNQEQLHSKIDYDQTTTNESILYRSSLINKFMIEALQLKINRKSLEEKHGQFLAAAAAGIAMLFYMVIFAWNAPSFVINSTYVVLLAVVLYIAKDRIKEELNKLFHKQALHWFPDYSTEIRDRSGRKIGTLNENFTFINERQIPKEFKQIRNHEFHEELKALKRHETIMHYKREIILYQQPKELEGKPGGLTFIFRFNIHQFLEKASNAILPLLTIDKESKELKEILLPKVYHLNIIIKSSFLKQNMKTKTEIKKFRIVIDKSGIKRVKRLTRSSK